MKIIEGIWIIVTVLVLFLFVSVYLTSTEKFKKRHPTAKTEKDLLGEKIYGYLMIFVLTAIPIINLLTLFILSTQYDDIVERTISIAENKIISEE